MNKGMVISAILVIVLCVIGGAFFAIKMPIINTGNFETNTKTEVEDVKDGWKKESGSWCFYKNNEKQKDWFKDNNSWYYLGSDGKMRTGWVKYKNQWYYLNGDGTMATNTTVNGCYLNNNGLIEVTPAKAKENSESYENDNNDRSTYKNYTNGRFLFSIDYPSDMIQQKGGVDGSGVSFISADGRVSLGAWGMNNATFETAEHYCNQELEYYNVKPYYKYLSKNSFTLSWQKDGMINYEYFIVGEGNSASFNQFSFKYPVNEKAHYDQVVERIRSSFRTPGINSSH